MAVHCQHYPRILLCAVGKITICIKTPGNLGDIQSHYLSDATIWSVTGTLACSSGGNGQVICFHTFGTPFPGITHHSSKPKYEIGLETLWTKVVFVDTLVLESFGCQ
jgi:hypothetical protein